MADASVCVRCGAPLPPATADSIACPFCGTTNVLRAPVPMAEVRQAVREVLYGERTQPAPRPDKRTSTAIVLVAVAFVVLSAFGTAVTFIGVRPKQTVKTVPPPPSPPIPPSLAKNKPPAETWGQLSAITIDEGGNVIASIGQRLVKADGRSLTPTWTVSRPAHFGSSRQLFTTKGDWISIATDNDISFFDTKTGTTSGTYRFKNGGILEGACAVGKSDVIVYVLGDGTMRFNADTAKKSTGADTCKLQEEFRCGPGQTCGWDHWTSGELDCRYVLRAGKDVYRVCEADDGTKQALVVRFDAQNKPKWRAPTDVRYFLGVVDGVLVASTDGSRSISAFDLESGKPKWTTKLGEQSPVFADAAHVYYGIEGTIVAANSAGREVARLPPPSTLAKN